MNKVILSIALFLLLPFSVIAAEDMQLPGEVVPIKRITQERVDLNREKIEKQLLRNKYWRSGLKIGSAVTVVFAASAAVWYLSKRGAVKASGSIPVESEPVKKLIDYIVPEDPTPDQTMLSFRSIKELFIRSSSNVKGDAPKVTWWMWSKSIGRRIGDLICIGTGYAVVKNINAKINKVFADRDLKWFIGANTTLEETLQELQHAAQQLNGEDISEYQREFYMGMLPRSCNRLIEQLEGIVAFMERANEQLPQEVVTAHGLSMMPCYLFSCVNDRCNDIELFLKQMQDDATDTSMQQKIELSVAQLETEIINTIDRYKAAFEVVTKEDDQQEPATQQA